MKKQLFSLALLGLAWLAGGSAQAWDEPSQEDGVYQLSTASHVEWFAQQVNEENRLTLNAVLLNDIDFTGVTHTPIGKDNDHKWRGEFDGQGHRIQNMVIGTQASPYSADGCGFFGHVRAGADGCTNVTIKNLIIDASCSIYSSAGNAAGIVGRIKDVQSGHYVTFENCGNEATINGGAGCAGILGGINSSTVRITFRNCFNTGNITGSKESAAICGWTGRNNNSNVVIADCWNSGTIVGMDNNKNLYRSAGTSISTSNLYDASETSNRTQGNLYQKCSVSDGTLCYIMNGDQSNIIWGQNLSNSNSHPLPIAYSSRVYCSGYNCPSSYNCTNSEATPTGTVPDSHTATPSCTFCNKLNETYLSPVDGYYQLSTVEHIEWFSAMVAAGNLTINGKLMNDIDFNSVENAHNPIGPSTGQKYNGTFDGQGFRIKNMIINRPTVDNQGFFGFLRGNNQDTYVKNLIIDSSCSITGKKAVGGIAANGQNNEKYIYIQNCVNEADITAMGGDAGGILGTSTSNHPRWIIQNCVNTGTITATSTSPYAGGLSGWMGDNSNSRIENFINIGTITYMDNDNHNIYRGNNITTSVLVDVSGTANATQGIVEGLSFADLSTGKVTYYVNNQAGSNVFFQNLTGENVDAYPVPFSNHGTVYVSAKLGCDGNPVGTATYSNENSSATVPPHTLGANGYCTVCGRNPVTSLSQDGDGYLLVSNAAELEFLSSMVNSAGGSVKKVKLTADIDLDGITHTPIGVDDGNKFCGEFDGDYHRILNMKLFSQDVRVGLFGGLRGAENTTIKNVIIDKSSKITGTRQMGGIAGACQTAISPLYLINCINEADVEGTGYQIAGMIGENLTDNMEIHITNCGNSGSIKADDANSCAIFGWARPGNVTVTNFWNTGKIIKGTNDHLERDGHSEGQAVAFNFYNANQSVMDAGNFVLDNCYDASASASRSQGTKLDASAATSGELTYKLGGAWKQLIGTDTHPMLSGSVVNYVGAAGYTTFYDADNNWELNGDAQAYIGTINGSSLHLDEIDDIPANTAVVISGTYYNKLAATSTTANTTGNVLLGSDGTITGGANIYALSQKSGAVGFYPVAASVTIPAGKAYLEYTASDPSSPVKGFTFVFDEDDATGISLMEDGRSQMEDGAIYNIAGQRISKMQKGINIVNGKKVLK